MAGSVWSDDNQVEQIKLKVDDRTRRIISSCNTMKEVWENLDAEYAQEQEVINTVNVELNKLRSMEITTAQYIVELRTQLPILEDVLQEVKGVEHLHSPDRVNFLVEKFDERTLYNWEYFYSKNEGATYKRFFNFLLDRYAASRSSIARHKSKTLKVTTNAVSVKCGSCALESHIAVNCPRKPTNTNSECHRCFQWVKQDGVHTCPGCGRDTPQNAKIPHCLEHCGAYLAMSVNERSKCVEKAKWCPIHRTGGHQFQDCNMKSDTKFICGISGCTKHHHTTLHGGTTPFLARINSSNINDQGMTGVNVLPLVQSVDTTSDKVTLFYDNGSTCCLITFAAAERLKLVGEPMIIEIKTVNGIKTLPSFAYHITLRDNEGNSYTSTVFGVANISNHRNAVDISCLKGEFSAELQSK